MSSLFGPCLARTPSPASLLLEAWTNNVETKKLIDKLLSAIDPPGNKNGGPRLKHGEESQEEVLQRRLAAFDRDMSVLSTVVTAIKALKKTSQCCMLSNSPGSMQELNIPKRDSVSSEKNRLLGLVFFQDEDDVAWSNINLIHSIDAITGLECRRRQDLDAIADKLGIRNQRQLDNARQKMDLSLDIIELLIAQNMQAQYLFRTVFLGTRICVS
ncbi:hypothetical protein SEUCBS139899_007903 [Sporothrix eucalyptigena]|uniref:Uncharacterized protein n=1 Tax=Sporothrix eucalyptigena TaxID=1812306 RepID=A0ABP0CDS5_9PEZI